MLKVNKKWLLPATFTILAAVAMCATPMGIQASAETSFVQEKVVERNAASDVRELTKGWNYLEDGSIFYALEDGTALTGVQEIDGAVYYFAPNGVLETGWQTVNGVRCYYDPETGQPVSGWIATDSNQYYIGETGKVVGFNEIDDKLYYFDDNGVMQTGFFKDNEGAIYYATAEEGIYRDGVLQVEDTNYLFAENGAIATGWQTIQGNRFYYDPDTAQPIYGWMNWNGGKYYISETGKLTGVVEAEGEYYPFDSETGVLTEGLCTLPDGNVRYYYADGKKKKGWYYTDEGDYYFDNSDNCNAARGLKQINSKLYYFDEECHMAKDIIVEVDGESYYFGEDGAAHYGVVSYEGSRYFFDYPSYQMVKSSWASSGTYMYYLQEDGKATEGWLTLEGKTYYFNTPYCHMVTGLKEIDDSYYGFDENGVMQTNCWFTDADGNKYYLGEDGKALTGMQTITGRKYYFSEEGIMQTGAVTIGEETYGFGTDGAMLIGWSTIGNSKYYFKASGVATTGWIVLNGTKYYFLDNGVMATGWNQIDGNKYYFDANGIVKTGWQTVSGKKYCFSSLGVMLTGWQTNTDGNKYYFDTTNGTMKTGWLTLDDKKYYLSASGVMVTGIQTIGSTKYYFLPTTGVLQLNYNQNGIVTNANGVVQSVSIYMEYVSQVGYPTGCESASAVMLLHQAGYSTTMDNFIDNALDKGSLTTVNGVLYGPSPNTAFIGDARSVHGYGCYAPVITNALNKLLNSGDKAVNLTGTSMSKLLTDYIDQGTPVAIWATINMIAPANGTQWYISGTNELFTWISHEHCLVLAGYDANYYYIYDPYNNNGYVKYDRATVDARYASLGYQAVVIQKG